MAGNMKFKNGILGPVAARVGQKNECALGKAESNVNDWNERSGSAVGGVFLRLVEEPEKIFAGSCCSVGGILFASRWLLVIKSA